MKIDLSNLLKGEGPTSWSKEDFKRYLKESLVEIIRLELGGLPKEEWERTLKVWSKICAFAQDLSKKGEKEREDFYKRFNFDSVMIHITEGIIEKLSIARSLGMLSEGERPDKLISLGLEVAEDSEEIRFMKKFFKA